MPKQCYLANESPEDTCKERLIPLPDSVHAAMLAMTSRSYPLYRAYADAARLWLKLKGVANEIPGIGELTVEEETLLRDVLHIYRNQSKGGLYRNAASAINLARMLAH